MGRGAEAAACALNSHSLSCWQTAAQRGIKLTSRSRPLTPADLREFDYILGMDASNLAAIRRAAQHWAAEHDVPADYAAKVPARRRLLPLMQAVQHTLGAAAGCGPEAWELRCYTRSRS